MLSETWTRLKGRPVIGLGLAVAVGTLMSVALLSNNGRTYETAVGEQRVLRLDDGTRLRLDTDSRVRVAMTDRTRTVSLLRGQALFEVAHDSSRPFVVEADGTSVRALGTRFDVRRLADGVKVTLIEGRVEVRQAGEQGPAVWTLAPGQQMTSGLRPRPPQKVDIDAATSWTSGRLVFRDVTLAHAISEVNRYSDRKIALESPRLSRAAVSGVFDSGDTEAFVAAVQALHPLERSEQVDGSILLREALTTE